MSNLIGIPSADYYETRLANMWNGTNGTVYVEKVPEGSMPISEYSYIVVNPGEVNMQVAKIDGWDSENDTFNVIDVAIPSGAGTYYNAKNHPVGSVVRFSNNYAFWKDIQEAINGKLDITSLAPVAVSNDYNDLCNKPTIPTDNCQLCNGCGYITGITCEQVEDALGYTPYDSTNPDGYTTCIGTVTNDDLQSYVKCSDIPDLSEVAKCCDIPTDNCQLSNGCGYTTCTGTLSSCGDITTALGYTPYSAANPCGYTTCTGTVSSCSDIISKLGYTPYSSANPNGYTSCTGTVVASDLTPYAKSCDLKAVATSGKYCDLTGTPTIPTNNNQLANGCGYTTCTGTVSTCADIISKLGYTPYNSTNPNGYTTCTGTLVPSNIACINGCCLTNGGDVCIESGGGGTVMCETSYDPGDYKQDFLYFTY